MNATKRIIQRNLSLAQMYILTGTNYVSIVDGGGCPCDNCGKLIANSAHVKGQTDGKNYTIGFDCLETFLINNQLLSGACIANYEIAKKSMAKAIKIKDSIKSLIAKNPFLDRVNLIYEYDPNYTHYVTFNFFAGTKQKWNDNEKVKIMDMGLLLSVLRSVMPNVRFEHYKNYKEETNSFNKELV